MGVKLKQIILVRHGRSAHADLRWLPPAQMPGWVDAYNAAAVDAADLPPPDVLVLGKRIAAVLTSDLPRAIASAWLIAPQVKPEVDPCFREAEIPYLGLGWPRLSPALWVASLRLVWVLGLRTGCESLVAARQRAEHATTLLEERSKVTGAVMVVGHGVFNRLIATVLRKRGWKGFRSLPSRHWGFAIFQTRAV